MDLWGPYRVADLNGARFFVTIVDDYIRNTWTQLLLNKTQVYTAIAQFFSMVKTQFKTKICVVRTNNDTEFIQSVCLDLFGYKGILHQRSIVKTPQRNRIVERKYRHLLDTARALRFQAGFPKQFWGECFLTATHIINKLPMAILCWQTPFERLYGFALDLADLRAIGCLFYATNVGEIDKFEPRAKRCVFLGYTFGFKGYKLYNLETKRVFHSKYVLFQEHVFPFKAPSQLISTTVSVPSFVWPHSEVSSDTPRHHHSSASPASMKSGPASISSIPGIVEAGSLLVSDSFSLLPLLPPLEICSGSPGGLL